MTWFCPIVPRHHRGQRSPEAQGDNLGDGDDGDGDDGDDDEVEDEFNDDDNNNKLERRRRRRRPGRRRKRLATPTTMTTTMMMTMPVTTTSMTTTMKNTWGPERKGRDTWADRGDDEKLVAYEPNAFEPIASDTTAVDEENKEKKKSKGMDAGMKSTGSKYSMFGTKSDKADVGGGKKVISTLVPKKKVRMGLNNIGF